tara:strand:+ start:3529 stop:3972 length:444 start_codon:yes stop_codon:yes gene_type:complete
MEETTNKIEIEVIGSPVPQGSLVGNPRFGGLRYSNDALLKEWRSKVIVALADKMPDDWDQSAPLFVSANFRFVRPKGHFGKKGLRPSAPDHKATKPDLDKLTRGIGDAIEQSGIARNDSQIVQWSVLKRWTEDQEPPGVLLIVTMRS